MSKIAEQTKQQLILFKIHLSKKALINAIFANKTPLQQDISQITSTFA